MLSNDTGTSTGKFISVVGGKWTIRVPEGTEGSVTRVNKNGDTVNELHFGKLTGELVSMAYKDTPFGKVVEIGLHDEKTGEDGVLSLTTNDQHLMTLAKMLPNINPTLPVDLILSLDKEKTAKKGKECFVLLARQGDAWVKHYHTMNNPNGMPEAVKKRDGSLSFDDQEDFLLGVIEEFFGAVEPSDDSPTAHYTDDDAPAEDEPF